MIRRPILPVRPAGLSDIPDWYKDAVIYEVRIRSFADSNDDGVGDINGLTAKLPYLLDLGVTALWLLPLYPSPGRDDGYDISDYREVHPDAGTLDDFQQLLEEAHRRGIRVITELVLNHTSDQHAWFQRARRAPPGSPERDFYVWSDDPLRYKLARIIFKDFEHSNWAYDQVAKAYYWHRFYSHQPDLNYENPLVRQAMLETVDFWLAMGVDGLRLDAVPYLYEKDGTNCENLPETHAFLKELRRHVDSKFGNRMLLAEANQWPEDAAAYFGDGDECQMNFHFPIMPRIFMSIHMEDRLPIVDILAQTPPLPHGAQWAMFLRNHDELTLEMVTDEERDYMYRAYAAEPSARVNLGIRRRLAPLLGNDRRKIELMHGLLLALPGTPVLYYGDEIGMGDNIYLGDRNGVRTPMQWSADKNAGFSKANPQKLILPIIIDPEYHYETINVEAEQANPSSLLWWVKRTLALRRRYQAFGRGSLDLVPSENPRVFAFVRSYEGDHVLVVANLSRHVQYVELDLSKHHGLVPVEMWGGTEFPPVSRHPYFLTLQGYAFFWFSLEKPRRARFEILGEMPVAPQLGVPASTVFTEGRPALERALPEYLESRRWYAGRGRELAACRITEVIALGDGPNAVHVVLLRTEYAHPPGETYALPLAVESGGRAQELVRDHPDAVVAALAGPDGSPPALLYDALQVSDQAGALLKTIREEARRRGKSGDLIASRWGDLTDLELESHRPRAEHRFTGTILGEHYIVKFFRRAAEGTSAELEMLRHLAKDPTLPVPPLAGALEFRPHRGEPFTLAILEGLVLHAVTGEKYTEEDLGRFFERVLTNRRGEEPPAPPTRSLYLLSDAEPPDAVRSEMGAFLDSMRLLGRRIADLHLALSAIDEPDFAPEPFSTFDQRSAYQTNRNLAGRVLRLLRARMPDLEPASQKLAEVLLDRVRDLYLRFEPLRDRRLTSLRCRYHGDMKLRKVLFTSKDVTFVGFEGDIDRPLPERRRKRSPLRDLAGMLLSIDEMAWKTLLEGVTIREGDRDFLAAWTAVWSAWACAACVSGYRERARQAVYMPTSEDETALLIDRFLFEKALKSLGQRLATRPAPVDRLLATLLDMLDRDVVRH